MTIVTTLLVGTSTSVTQEQHQLQLQQQRTGLALAAGQGMTWGGLPGVDLGGATLRPMGRSSSLLFPRPLRLPHALSLDYVRAEDRALCLNPREFLKYRPEKVIPPPLSGGSMGAWVELPQILGRCSSLLCSTSMPSRSNENEYQNLYGAQ